MKGGFGLLHFNKSLLVLKKLLDNVTIVNILWYIRPRSNGTGRIFVQIHLAFTRDPRNRMNSSTANRTNSRPTKIRSRFLRDRSQILTNPCEQRNRSFSRLICTVGNWNELDNAMKPGLSNKHEV